MHASTIFSALTSAAAVMALPQAQGGSPQHRLGQLVSICTDFDLKGTCIPLTAPDLGVCKNLIDPAIGLNDVVSSLVVNEFVQCTMWFDADCKGLNEKFPPGVVNAVLAQANDQFSSIRCVGL